MPDRSLVLNAKAAIARHVQWKITLQLAITMQEQLSAEHLHQILKYRDCAIGRWLDSAATLPVRGRQEYIDLVQKHIEFHNEMRKVSDLIGAKRFEDAARSIAPLSSFIQSSMALANAMMVYDRVAAMVVPL